ncbi:MAG: hypothetical protein AAGK57_13165, partial [Pseudomonadota bacterium]
IRHEGAPLSADCCAIACRAVDGMIFAAFFPPAVSRWARMMELSMTAMGSGDRSAKAFKTLIQTPAFAPRLNRL